MVATAEKRAYKAEWERGKRRSETFEERECRLAKRREVYAQRATDETRAEARERRRQWRETPGNVEKQRQDCRAWYDENREYALAAVAEYQARPENAERVKEIKQKWGRKNKRATQAAQRQKRYGLSQEDYDTLLRKQDFKCAICGSADSGRKDSDIFAVDHDHQTGHIRGLLCGPCNVGLGMMRDDPARLDKAKAYLRQTEVSA